MAGDDETPARAGTTRLFAEFVTPPRLSLVDGPAVAKFLRDYAAYIIRFKELQEQSGDEAAKATSMVSCLEAGTIDTMLFLRDFGEEITSVDQLSDQIVHPVLEAKASAVPVETQEAVLAKSVSKCRVNMTISGQENRVRDLIRQFRTVLAVEGLRTLPEENPEKTNMSLFGLLHSKEFQANIGRAIRHDSSIQRKSFADFCQFVLGKARKIEPYLEDLMAGSYRKTNRETQVEDKKKPSHRRHQDSIKAVNDNEDPAAKKPKPECLNKRCKERHFIRDCPMTDRTLAEKLTKEWKESRQKAQEGGQEGSGVGRGIGKSHGNNARRVSVAHKKPPFQGLFVGKVESVVVPDTGSDANILGSGLIDQIEALADTDVNTVTLPEPKVFETAVAGGQSLVCDKERTVDLWLPVRHGRYLKLRQLRWLIPSEATPVKHTLLGKETMEMIGFDMEKVLEAAYAKTQESPEVEGTKYQVRVLGTPDEKQLNIYHSGPHGEILLDDDDLAPMFDLDVGVHEPAKVSEAVEELLSRATKDAKLTVAEAGQLASLVKSNLDLFRLKLGIEPPANVRPMDVELYQSSRPHVAKVRTYGTSQRKFMDAYFAAQVKYGWMTSNPNSLYASPPMIAPKPPPQRWRLTRDYRRTNADTKPMHWPMPHVDSVMVDARGSKYFGSLDFVYAYAQMPLTERAKEILSVITPTGIYSPERAQAGARNTGPYFQSVIEPLFTAGDLREKVQVWMDNLMLHADSLESFLATLDKIFDVARKTGLFFSARKSCLGALEICWNGRIIDGDGFRMDPSRLSALQEWSSPVVGGELSQFVHACTWMRSAISDFSALISPMRALLEQVYTAAKGVRTRRAVANISLTEALVWTDVHEASFRKIQRCLVDGVKLSHADPDKVVCVFTDASAAYWSGVITQIPIEDVGQEIDGARHEPLAFVGGSFDATQQAWSTYETEGYAVTTTFRQHEYLVCGSRHTTQVFMDHNNLLYLYTPRTYNPNASRPTVQKSQRWGLAMSQYDYDINHVPGEDNHCADMLTRWIRNYRGLSEPVQPAVRVLCPRKQAKPLHIEPVYPSPRSKEFDWPTVAEIRGAQIETEGARPPGALQNGLWSTPNGAVWIPIGAETLRTRLLIICHCGYAGHRAADATWQTINPLYFWHGAEADTKRFCKNCLFRLMTLGGCRIPRPFGSAPLHGTVPGQVIQSDFLFMGKDPASKLSYVLIVRCEHSTYVWLRPSIRADSETAASVLFEWVTTFCTPQWLVSDGGSHFKNEVMRILAAKMLVEHHITTAYVSQANGTVERLCREVLRAARALLAEFEMSPADWPAVIPGEQSMLNSTPRRRLGNRTPLEVFTGQRSTPPAIMPLREATVTELEGVKSIACAEAAKLTSLDRVQQALDETHRDVATRVSKERQRQIARHNKQTQVQVANFSTGQWVLVARLKGLGDKLTCRWTGPRQITMVVNDQVYEVEEMINRKRSFVHSSRLKFYREADLEKSAQLQRVAINSEKSLFLVNEFLELAEPTDGSTILALTSWLGFPDEEDNSWQEILDLHRDVPKRLNEYLESLPPSQVRSRAMSIVNLASSQRAV